MTPRNNAAIEHAMTMLYWHRDNRRTARTVVGLFSVVAVAESILWLGTEAVPFAFIALFSLAVVIAAAFAAHWQDTKVTHWEERFRVLMAPARDSNIHIIVDGTISAAKIGAELNKFPGRIEL